MVFVPYPAEDQTRFSELAEIYEACRDAYRGVATETNATPATGSRCALDRDELRRRQPPIAEGSEGWILWTVEVYLYAASEHIGALSALYREMEVIIPPLVLARAAIESSAHVIWILGSPETSAEDRLARSFLEVIFGAEEAKKQAGRIRGKTDEDHRERTKHYRELKKDAAATFDPPHQDDSGRLLLRGHRMPSPEQVVVEMNQLVSQPLAESVMQGTYGLLSNFVHPTFYALQELFSVTEENGVKTPALNRDISFHDGLARLVVSPFYHALAFVTSYYGSAPARFAELSQDILRLLPGMFVAGPSPGTPRPEDGQQSRR